MNTLPLAFDSVTYWAGGASSLSSLTCSALPLDLRAAQVTAHIRHLPQTPLFPSEEA